MKKLLITTAGFALMAVSAWSQGNIFFSNEPLSTQNAVNAPVTAEDRVTRLAGAAFQAQLYARPAGSSSAYAAMGAAVPFLTTTPNGTGYWTPSSRSVPGVAAGAQAQVVARVWRVADGATWDAAQATGRGYGESAPLNITLTAPPALPAPMVGLQPFSLVPEPSTIALGIIGGLGTLVLIRRRK
jgi:hypothetical protein